MDFDETRIYYSQQQLRQTQDGANDDATSAPSDIPTDALRRHFVQFLRNYRNASRYIYRDALLRMHRTAESSITTDLAHIGEYDPSLSGYLMDQPAATLPVFESAASDALLSLLFEKDNDPEEDEEENPQIDVTKAPKFKIQVLLAGNLKLTALRSIQSSHMNKLVQCPGIIISSSKVKNRAVRLKLRCNSCGIKTATIDPTQPAVRFPQCDGMVRETPCPKDSMQTVPDESKFTDQQICKLQEAPERVPTGELPRSIQLVLERSLVDTAPPGTRVWVLCVPSVRYNNTVHLQVMGLQRENDSHGNAVNFTAPEEAAFCALAKHPDVYDILTRSVAPTIQGSYVVDIKKALTAQLFGGSRKFLRDGVRLRGDINVLLLGDPSMAKSQFLKFISQAAPVGVYTSGKGSSAAGLTASVVRDRKGEFFLEGGAMVLADGGIVCIDEFDKMAIHEAMEQQTISIAKAGITTVLNSRTAVLAAANPVYGRYDELRAASDNIDLMTTILSRFDMIFLVRDIRQEERDRMICQHVMGVHMDHTAGPEQSNRLLSDGDSEDSPEAIAENVLRVATTGLGRLTSGSLKKYVQYCKSKCSPRLSEDAGEVLISNYVKIRDDVRQRGDDVIPITVRQLEALVRIAESLAKMRIDDNVSPADVTESLRLFRVSTMAANNAGDNPTVMPNREDLVRTENYLKARLMIGSLVNRQRLIEEAAGQGHDAVLVARALSIMAGRGELLERNQGRLVKRVK